MDFNLPIEKILPLHFIHDPEDRTYFVYILSASLIAGFYFFYHFKSFAIKKFLLYFFNPKALFHYSSRIDIYLFIFNYWLRVMLIVPIIFSEVLIIEKTKGCFEFILPKYQPIALNPLFYSILFSLVLFVIADFFRFFYHYLSHKIPFLWELHKVHHSAITLNPLTTYRVHPLDVVILIIKQILVTGVVAGVFSFFVIGEYAMLTIFGVQFFGLVINFFGANLRHSHIPISFGKKLETIFVSPIMHQMHHAINKNNNLVNLGSSLSIWDFLFKTYQRPDFKPMRFGLPKSQRTKNLYNVIINPFVYFSFRNKKPIEKNIAHKKTIPPEAISRTPLNLISHL